MFLRQQKHCLPLTVNVSRDIHITRKAPYCKGRAMMFVSTFIIPDGSERYADERLLTGAPASVGGT
jgi:hypothetical protein